MPYQSIFRPGLFSGQTVIVTGGGSGIGRCTAHELAFLGAHVALVGRKIDKLQTVGAEIVRNALNTAQGYDAFLRADYAKMQRAVALAGIKPE